MDLYTYKWKNSDQVVDRVSACSQRQAEVKLGVKRGHSWTKEALETGLIYFSGVTEVEEKKTKHTDEEIQKMWWNN